MTPRRPSRRQGETCDAGQDATRRDPRRGRGGRGQAPHPRLQDRQNGGEEITLVGVYGDISTLPIGEIEELPGVEQLIPISRAYKRAAQKGPPDRPIYQRVAIGNVVCGATSSASSPARARSRARRRSWRPPAW